MQTRSSPNLSTLHRLANEAGISGYQNMSKADLFRRLQEQFDVARLLRKEAREVKLEQLNLSKKRKRDYGCSSSSSVTSQSTSSQSSAPAQKRVKLNRLDPIMFTPIASKKCFKFVRPNGTIVRFNIESLVDYILSTGDFTDPETRIPFSDNDLLEIDGIARRVGLKKSSVVEAKSNTHFYAESKFHRDALLGLERCAGEVVADILQIIETSDPDEAQMQLVMREFPTFLDYYRQLRDADSTYASKCLQQWKQFIEGPPNRPNRDEYGLLHVAYQFLRSCEDGVF